MSDAIPADEHDVVRVAINICRPCLDGVGQECHTPGCALWMHKVDLPIDSSAYTELIPPGLDENVDALRSWATENRYLTTVAGHALNVLDEYDRLARDELARGRGPTHPTNAVQDT